MAFNVLFVRRSCVNLEEIGRRDVQFDAETKVVGELKRNFEIEDSFDLSHYHITQVAYAAERGNPFDAMVTQVPPINNGMVEKYDDETRKEYLQRAYGKSLSILASIKMRSPDLPIIGYSGVGRNPDIEDIFVENGPLRVIISKSHPNNWEEDARKIKSKLERYILRG